ncbi:HAD family hydrolase [Candidatus Woesearchaeota archaeon]|nr:HAD family hydrolase [Candidatus Woesearchaeota archaeon]
MKKLICFDLDNTLIYSDKCHILAYNYALKQEKLAVPSKKFLVSLFGMPHYKLIELIAPDLDSEDIEKLTRLHDNILVRKTYKYSNAVAGTVKTLDTLKKDYNLAILSNSSHRNIILLLKGAKIDKNLFKIIIGNDDVKRSKPYPDEIFKAEHLFHTKADFMIGDSIYDMLAGKRANVKTIGVLTGHYPRMLLKKQGADYIIKSVNKLPQLLKEVNNK